MCDVLWDCYCRGLVLLDGGGRKQVIWCMTSEYLASANGNQERAYENVLEETPSSVWLENSMAREETENVG